MFNVLERENGNYDKVTKQNIVISNSVSEVKEKCFYYSH